MRAFNPKEYTVTALRECPTPMEMQLCDTPDRAYAYWQTHLESDPHFDPERECLVVLLLNVRRRIKGHVFVSHGTPDSILVDSRAVFRAAVIASAYAVVLLHNHPSGEATPSVADIKVTRTLISAGQIVGIEVIDHVIVGHGQFSSLRQLGYFAR